MEKPPWKSTLPSQGDYFLATIVAIVDGSDPMLVVLIAAIEVEGVAVDGNAWEEVLIDLRVDCNCGRLGEIKVGGGVVGHVVFSVVTPTR